MTNTNSNVKSVLFVCVENSCRSQMAEALFNGVKDKGLKAYSAGSKPSGKVNALAKQVMKEIGIDISSNASKGVQSLPVRKFDYVIGMGCKDSCPLVSAVEHIEWQITDPKGRDIDFFRKTRDEIKVKIQELVNRIKKGEHEKV